MTIRHLKVFISVCENNSISKAAEELHIAQPSVSQTISELEKFYGVSLFSRINRRLTITEAGKQLYIKAKNVIESFSDFEETAYRSGNDSKVMIGSTLTIGKLMIPKLISEIKKNHSDISPFVRISNAAEVEASLLSGETDFALIESSISSPCLSGIRFAGDRLTVIAGIDFPVPDTISAKELAGFPLLVREKGSASRDLLESIFAELGLRFDPLIESHSNEAVLEAALENIGVAVLPSSLVKKALEERKLKEISVEKVSFQRDFHIAFITNKQFTPAQRKAIQLCIDSNCF